MITKEDVKQFYYNGVFTGIICGLAVCTFVFACLFVGLVIHPHKIYEANGYHSSELIIITKDGIYDCDFERCLLLTVPNVLKECQCGDEFDFHFRPDAPPIYYYTNITPSRPHLLSDIIIPLKSLKPTPSPTNTY